MGHNELVFSSIKENLKLVLSEHVEIIWFTKLTQESAMRGTGLNKLRTYRKYKQYILTESYVIVPLSKYQRSALVKFCISNWFAAFCTYCNTWSILLQAYCNTWSILHQAYCNTWSILLQAYCNTWSILLQANCNTDQYST